MGKWKALEVIDTSIDETRSLLFPVKKALWLKLALVVMIMGGFGGGAGNYNMGGPGDYYGVDQDPSTDAEIEDMANSTGAFFAKYGLYVAAGVLLLVLLVVLLMYVGDVLQFVFLRGVVDGRVEVMDWSMDNMGKGISLFLFRIGAGVATLVLFGIASMPFLLGVASDYTPLVMVGTVLGAILFLAIVILASVVFMAKADFVVPVMHFKDRGIWAACMDVFYLVKQDPWQFALYVLIRTLLSIAGGIVSLLIMIPLMIVWLILVAVFGGLVWVMVSALGITPDTLGLGGWTLVVFTILVLGISFIYSISLATLPVPVYLRMYSLLFLMTQDHSLVVPSMVDQPGPLD